MKKRLGSLILAALMCGGQSLSAYDVGNVDMSAIYKELMKSEREFKQQEAQKAFERTSEIKIINRSKKYWLIAWASMKSGRWEMRGAAPNDTAKLPPSTFINVFAVPIEKFNAGIYWGGDEEKGICLQFVPQSGATYEFDAGNAVFGRAGMNRIGIKDAKGNVLTGSNVYNLKQTLQKIQKH